MLNEGEELVIGGDFTDCNQAVSVKRGIALRLKSCSQTRKKQIPGFCCMQNMHLKVKTES